MIDAAARYSHGVLFRHSAMWTLIIGVISPGILKGFNTVFCGLVQCESMGRGRIQNDTYSDAGLLKCKQGRWRNKEVPDTVRYLLDRLCSCEQ
jgi:hypothetical protein